MSRPIFRTALLVAPLLLTMACGDRRLKDLSVGITRDSVNTVMGTETPHRASSYLMEGKFWEVLYYAKPGTAEADSVDWKELSPVVITDGAVSGWGWKYWRPEAERLRVELPAEE